MSLFVKGAVPVFCIDGCTLDIGGRIKGMPPDPISPILAPPNIGPEPIIDPIPAPAPDTPVPTLPGYAPPNDDEPPRLGGGAIILAGMTPMPGAAVNGGGMPTGVPNGLGPGARIG